jgi:hypothetical protein
MKKLLFAFTISCFILSSCIKIDVSQSSDISGDSSIVMELDMSEYLKKVKILAESQTGITTQKVEKIDYCTEVEKHPLFDTQDCYQKSEEIFGIDGTLNLIKNGWMVVEGKNSYALDVRSMVPKILNSDEKTFQENYNGSGSDSPQSLGFKYTYTLELPVLSQNVVIDGREIEIINGNARFSFGSVTDNVLSFDIFEMLNSESFIVYG